MLQNLFQQLEFCDYKVFASFTHIVILTLKLHGGDNGTITQLDRLLVGLEEHSERNPLSWTLNPI